MLKQIQKISKQFFKVEIVVLVGPCQKRDIVDTFSHASRATCHNMYKQTDFPTIWRKAERTLPYMINGYFWCLI
jgi:hypothetical protein